MRGFKVYFACTKDTHLYTYFVAEKVIFRHFKVCLCKKHIKSKNHINDLFTWFFVICGRGSKNRTHDTRFWRPLLYLLSYTPTKLVGHRGLEPRTDRL